MDLEELKAKLANWKIPNADKSEKSTGKTSKYCLSVTFPDGEMICENKVINTFIKTIEKIGFNEVMKLGLTASGVPLIDTKPHEVKRVHNDNVYKEYGGYFIFGNTNTDLKKNQLKEISNRLNVGLIIEHNVTQATNSDNMVKKIKKSHDKQEDFNQYEQLFKNGNDLTFLETLFGDKPYFQQWKQEKIKQQKDFNQYEQLFNNGNDLIFLETLFGNEPCFAQWKNSKING